MTGSNTRSDTKTNRGNAFKEIHHQHLELVTERAERFETTLDAVEIFKSTGMHKAPQETFWVLTYGPQLDVARVFEVNRGKYLTVDLHMPALLAGVLTAGTERFVLAHNHSTNNVEPSQYDVELTQAVMKAANITRLYFEEHLILTPEGEYYSFTEHGLLVPDKKSMYFNPKARTARAAAKSKVMDE